MPTNSPSHQRYLDLARRLVATVVSDDQQTPIVVYRGEHGTSTDAIHGRTRTVSFGSVAAANTYAVEPNKRHEEPAAPRVMAAYLSIKNPVIKDPDDPFIDMSTIAEKLGPEKAELIARRLADHIEYTNNWVDGFASQYESVAQLLDLEPGRLSELYLDAYPVFDDDEIVGWFADAGYDGAIHSGNGETAMEAEYKVFDRSQVHFAIGIEHAALARAMIIARAEQLVQARIGTDTPVLPDASLCQAESERKSTLLRFVSNYRGQTDYLVLAGPLASKRVTYRYMKREFYEQDYAVYGAQVWRGDPGSYRRQVLASVGLVCCNGVRVPQEIVDELNRMSQVWREISPELFREPARSGVYVYGHGWTEAADIVFQYGDVLERFTSLVSAEQWLSQPARATPDRVWEESPGGEVMRELAPAISGNRIVLVDLPEESIEHEEEMLMAPAA